MVTLPLYQPFAFGAVVAAAVMAGAVASRRMPAVVTLALPPALTAVQVAVAPEAEPNPGAHAVRATTEL